MSNSDLLSDDALPKKLAPLGTYCWPHGETKQTLEHIFEILWSKVTWLSEKDPVSEQMLHTFKERSTIDAAQKKLSEILFNCFDATYLDWIDDPSCKKGARAFVYAPMEQHVLKDWADARGYTVFEQFKDYAPEHNSKVFVFPNIEAQLLRRDDAICEMRDTLAQIAKSETKLIVGCNSWAWRYLRSVTSIDLIFERPQTIPAFDADALASLLKPIIADAGDLEKYFSVETDDPIFATDKDGDLVDPYFTKLAKRSLGLPWVAIEMFFDDAVSSQDEDGKRNDERTWLKFSTPPKLPSSNTAQLCMALQNLLIHGPCTQEKLAQLCPKETPDHIWSALKRTGFVEFDGELTRISTRHYPAIRSALGTAGLNLDKL